MSHINQSNNPASATKKAGRQAIGALAAMVLVFGCASAFGQTKEEMTCIALTDITMAMFEARKKGVTQAQASELLREQKIYSGPVVNAVNTAYKVKITTPELMLRGTFWQSCLERAKHE